MVSELKLAYYAGLFDGEGCVMIQPIVRRNRLKTLALVARVSMCDSIALRELLKDFGGSKLYLGRCKNGRQRELFSWVVGSQVASRFLQAIYPYTFVKKEQIALALAFQHRIDDKLHRFARLSDGELAIRHELRERLQVLKKIAVHGATNAMGAKTGNGETPNPVLTRRQSLKCVETIYPRQSSEDERQEIVHSNGN